MATSAVELVGIRKRYRPADPPVLDGVSLCVDAGRVLVLLGTTGSGKTTTLPTVNGLVQPDEGRVRVFGEDVARADLVALRRRIGYVIQEGGLLPHWTVLDNVVLVPRLLGWSNEDRTARGIELLRLVGLDADLVRGRRPADLSSTVASRAWTRDLTR